MKRITYAGGSIVTGSAVADALLEYITHVAITATSVTVDIPVLETDGKTTTHTLLVGPASQFDVSDVDGFSDEEETSRFPVPALPQTVEAAVSEPSAEASKAAHAFDQAVADIEDSLGQNPLS